MDQYALIWLGVGAFFLIVELFATQFVTLWFGLAALVVAFTLVLLPTTPLVAQIFIWIVLSVLMAWLWFSKGRTLFQKRKTTDFIGQIGHIVEFSPQTMSGLIRFTLPVNGKIEWPFSSHTMFELGDRAIVSSNEDNKLLVEAVQHLKLH